MEQKFYGSLVRRVILICLVLVVAPLIFYAALVWNRDWKVRINTVFSQFELVGESGIKLFNQWRHLRLVQLENFTRQLDDSTVSTKFIFDSSLTCTFSTETSMEGKGGFFPEAFKNASKAESYVFAGVNPFTNREEIFIVKQLDNECRGLSVYADQWLRLFAPDRQFIPSILTPSNLLIFSVEPRFNQSEVKQFSLEKLEAWKKEISFSLARDLQEHPLAVVLALPETQFHLQVGLSAEQVALIEGVEVVYHLMGIFILLILVGGIGTWWLTRKMARPFSQLSRVMEAVQEKDYARRYTPDKYGFEINALGDNFNQMLEALISNMEEAKNQRVAREILVRELEIGRKVQKELLPRSIPQLPHLAFGVGFVPAKEVAGDFYDLFVLDENHLMLSIADGSDKGISACLYSLIVRSLLRSYASGQKELKDIIVQTNNLFCDDTADTGNFVTAWVGVYHAKDKRLTYTCAGHLPAILLHPNGEIEEVTTEGIALGVDEIQNVEVRDIALSTGSLLFLYTDGVLEAHNEKGELFGKSRLMKFLQDASNLAPQALIDQLTLEVKQFCQQAPQHDDLTFLCIKLL